MILGHKIRLKPYQEAKTYFAKASGVARFAYNWALDNWQQQYNSGLKPSEAKLRKVLNSIKKDDYPWMLEVTKVAPQQAIKNLGMAFKRFFNKQGKYPKFKKKGIHVLLVSEREQPYDTAFSESLHLLPEKSLQDTLT